MLSWFVSMFNGIWTFFKPLLTLYCNKAGKMVLASAATVVPIVAQRMVGSIGKDKADAAYAMIVKDLEAQGLRLGIDFVTAMVNSAIEAAYVKLPDDLK